MRSIATSRVLNVGMRVATLGSRFLLLFVMAGCLAPASVGEFGIVSVTVSYALYLAGIDFYTYSTRELLGEARDAWPRILRNQAVFQLVCYIVTLPLLAVTLGLSAMLPGRLIAWVLLLLLLEHIAQEMTRLLTVMSHTLRATTLLFVRSGATAIAGGIGLLASPELRTLDWVLGTWACGAACSVLLAVRPLMQLDWRAGKQDVDWGWIARGIRVALPLLAATLAMRGLFTVDRYLEQAYAGPALVGVYTFFAGMAGALVALLDAGVIAFLYPRVVAAARTSDAIAFASTYRQMACSTLILTGSFVLAAVLLVWPVLAVVAKPIYREHVDLFFLLVAASALFSLSLVPHYALYALGRDRDILIINLLAIALFLAIATCIGTRVPQQAVPIALVAAFGFMACGKVVRLKCVRSSRNGWTPNRA